MIKKIPNQMKEIVLKDLDGISIFTDGKKSLLFMKLGDEEEGFHKIAITYKLGEEMKLHHALDKYDLNSASLGFNLGDFEKSYIVEFAANSAALHLGEEKFVEPSDYIEKYRAFHFN